MKILFYGIGGAMGKTFFSCAKETNDCEIVCGVDKFANGQEFPFPVYKDCSDIKEKPDCIIDFSHHTSIYDYLPYAVKNKIPCVIATTGFSEEETAFINEQKNSIPVLKSGNMSLGVNTLLQLAKISSKILGDKADIEIIEYHHNKKADAPSGTALLIADGIKKELPSHENVIGRSGSEKRKPTDIGINSVRGGTIVGRHDVMFIMNNEVITLTHEAESKAIFANGAINAAKYIIKQNPGLYSMEDMFKSETNR